MDAAHVLPAQMLHQFKIFSELDPPDLDAVAEISQLKQLQAGEGLMAEGAAANDLYLIVKGKAAVKVRSPEGRQMLIDQLGPGELLGWSAAIEPHIYVASAWTIEPSEVIVIPGDRLRGLFETNRHIGYEVTKGIGEVMSRRLGKAIGTYDIDQLRRFKIFAKLDRAQLDSLARISHIQEYGAGQQLTAEGAVADKLYLLLKGKAAVKVRSPEGEQVLIDQAGPGDLVGW